MSSRPRAIVVVLVAAASVGCGVVSGPRGRLPRRLGDWQRLGAVERYDANRLFEAIDGEAPSVVAFGFRVLEEAEYRHQDGATATVHLFEMTTPTGAFGLFRFRSNFRHKPMAIGTEGAGGDGVLDFWHGRYYASLASAASTADLGSLARILVARLGPGCPLPASLRLLPRQGRVPRSEEWVPTDFMGYGFLKNVVKADYEVGGRRVTVFACEFPTGEAARAALARLRGRLGGGEGAEALSLGQEGFVAARPYSGKVAIFRIGRHLGGMLRYGKEPAALSLLENLAQRLRGAQGS